MGEWVHTDICIGGTASETVAEELVALLAADFSEVHQPETERHWLHAFGERNYGNADEVEEFCQRHGLPYVLSWSSCSAFEAGMHAWRPGMEEAEQFDGDELPAMGLRELEREARAGKTLADVIAAMSIGDAKSLPPYVVELGEPIEAEANTPGAALSEFLCIGTYDDGQRFAETVQAADAEAAEAIAHLNWPSVNWAGFIALRDGVMTVEG